MYRRPAKRIGIESAFATVRPRHRQTKGCASWQAPLAAVFILARRADDGLCGAGCAGATVGFAAWGAPVVSYLKSSQWRVADSAPVNRTNPSTLRTSEAETPLVSDMAAAVSLNRQ